MKEVKDNWVTMTGRMEGIENRLEKLEEKNRKGEKGRKRKGGQQKTAAGFKEVP